MRVDSVPDPEIVNQGDVIVRVSAAMFCDKKDGCTKVVMRP
jgi:hypothetical protein